MRLIHCIIQTLPTLKTLSLNGKIQLLPKDSASPLAARKPQSKPVFVVDSIICSCCFCDACGPRALQMVSSAAPSLPRFLTLLVCPHIPRLSLSLATFAEYL